jgi:hypothetical protein
MVKSAEKNVADKLNILYKSRSKHSSYQSLPKSLIPLLGNEIEPGQERKEKSRMDYIWQHIDLNGKHILDIGGNTGYFTFESIEHGAKTVRYYEGNKDHAAFVATAASHLELSEKINVINEYFTFELQENKDLFDVCFCLNVVHHLGDDYGDQALDMETAKSVMLDSVNALAAKCEILIFQMGFNWKGDVELPLFPNGTKLELEEFVRTGVEKYFDILHCGLATGNRNSVVYEALSEKNFQRNDALGEFLNRPLFIMRSKKISDDT